MLKKKVKEKKGPLSKDKTINKTRLRDGAGIVMLR